MSNAFLVSAAMESILQAVRQKEIEEDSPISFKKNRTLQFTVENKQIWVKQGAIAHLIQKFVAIKLTVAGTRKQKYSISS